MCGLIVNIGYLYLVILSIHMTGVDSLYPDTAFTPPRIWDYDVYTGRQFNYLVTDSTSTDNIVIHPVLLILFAPDCYDEAVQFKLDLRPSGPMDKYLTLTMHDYVIYPNHIWYELDDIDNLYTRYMDEGNDESPCMKVLYFGQGSRLTRPEVFDHSIHLHDWVWQKMVVQLKVINNMDTAIKVLLEGGHKGPIYKARLEPWDTMDVDAHISMYITVYNITGQSLLYYQLIQPYSNYENIRISPESLEDFRNTHQSEWLMQGREQLEHDSALVKTKQWNLALNLLLSFKQPVLCPKFTELGYKLIRIPDDVYELLSSFYHEFQHKRQSESARGGLSLEPLVNHDDVMTTMVALSQEVKDAVYDALLEEMESWCNCELEGTAFYGIREYYHGSVLRSHVDRVETHVISSILQIDKDLGDSDQDWDLEIITYDGYREYIQLHPGDMLLYESATLVHGRPTPFQGERYANCFLHYRPVDDWNWYTTDDVEGNPILTDGQIEERVDVINTWATTPLEEDNYGDQDEMQFNGDQEEMQFRDEL